ncbi:error-prone DNA polymerase [Aurantiacibacter gangjinensis]|uniref:Error-prone DNA polymerase n=1 Tax=Aurantiacibacter gangjinensis TaxID=502682 RepID=A0A0G9MKD7_9SPHN|nr:error-prone DNA polymerase [Aurantiacibacter gangjinensis]APE29429.1 DNA polymerase III alpha subunit [Aurantiacibacter gangjinensis]KLE31181.1 DNA polymerase [Aurantiacibacter gangjinensis]
MPDAPLTPDKRTILDDGSRSPLPPSPYVELGLASCFSFLRGASDAVDYAVTAYAMGYDTLGIADRNSMAGAVRHWTEMRNIRQRPLVGCRLVTMVHDGQPQREFLAYPRTREGYGRLTAMLSAAKMRSVDGKWQDKDACDLTLEMVAGAVGQSPQDMVLIALPPEDLDGFAHDLPALVRDMPALSHIAASRLYRGDDRARINRLDALARAHRLQIVATNDVLYHEPASRPLADVMACIREKCTIADAGALLEQNGERHLKPPQEMQRLFAEWPHAIAETRAIADSIGFDLGDLQYEYPDLDLAPGTTPDDHLAKLSWEGATKRYPDGIPEKVHAAIARELHLIAKMDIARYFITIYDIVQHARSLGILCQGRGSAANSAVCYCLEITAVDPATTDLLFERFISEERKEPPDIDVDFEHERREEVIQHIYEHYGRERAGLCATIVHYRPRMAIREVGKVMGLSEDVTGAMAKTVWGSWGSEVNEERAESEAGLDLSDPHLRRVIALANQLIGKPRHLGQHVGGFILTRSPLTQVVPIGNGAMPDRSFIEWDKDDIDALGIMKIDVLALGMLTCIRKCFDLLQAHCGETHTLASIEQEDQNVYAMLQRGDSLGVFQVESRAQMNMLPRLRPKTFYDLVIQVAIVRPGPIQGDMVHPYLKRRKGREEPFYPEPAPEHGPPDELRNILKRTLGVPIFQEQAMKIAMVAARFSPREANQLRRAMATFRNRGGVSEHKERMVGRMIERGYDPDFAARCFSQIEGFGEYGFPESHAASFAHLVYVSSWIKHYHPAIFACGLLNSQPMGFYAPAQIVRDAREHGVKVLAPDVNMSDWDNTVEWQMVDGQRQLVLRLGLRQVDGLAEVDAAKLLSARTSPFADVEALRTRARLGTRPINLLAAADAFRSMGKDRRDALWDARALKNAPDLPLFTHADARDEGEDVPVLLPAMPLSEHVVADYQTTRLSLKGHPMGFLREHYTARGFTRAADLRACRFNQRVSVAGVVLIRQRPGSAKGVVFITLEDESGVINLVVWPDAMEANRKVIMGARLMRVHGTVQMDEDVIHVVAREMHDDTAKLSLLSDDMLKPDLARADHVVKPLQGSWPSNTGRHPRDVSVIPRSRDFH